MVLMGKEEGARIGDRPREGENGGVYLLAFATGLLGHDAGTRSERDFNVLTNWHVFRVE